MGPRHHSAERGIAQCFRRRNYRHAREIMEQLLQSNIAAKPVEDFTKKLKDIDAIANPAQP